MPKGAHRGWGESPYDSGSPGPATSPKLALLKGLWVDREGNQRYPEAKAVTLLWPLFPPPHHSLLPRPQSQGLPRGRKGPTAPV